MKLIDLTKGLPPLSGGNEAAMAAPKLDLAQRARIRDGPNYRSTLNGPDV
jgi:hypothetical protein